MGTRTTTALHDLAVHWNTPQNEKVCARRAHTKSLGLPELPPGWMWMRGHELIERMTADGLGITMIDEYRSTTVAYSSTLNWVMGAPGAGVMVRASSLTHDVIQAAEIVIALSSTGTGASPEEKD